MKHFSILQYKSSHYIKIYWNTSKFVEIRKIYRCIIKCIRIFRTYQWKLKILKYTSKDIEMYRTGLNMKEFMNYIEVYWFELIELLNCSNNSNYLNSSNMFEPSDFSTVHELFEPFELLSKPRKEQVFSGKLEWLTKKMKITSILGGFIVRPYLLCNSSNYTKPPFR